MLNSVTGNDFDIIFTHWGQVMHICISKLNIIGSDNGLLLGWRQATIWTNAGILLIGPLGTNFSEILIEIYTFSLKKIHLNILSGKGRPSCLGLNVLNKMLCNFCMFWIGCLLLWSMCFSVDHLSSRLSVTGPQLLDMCTDTNHARDTRQ